MGRRSSLPPPVTAIALLLIGSADARRVDETIALDRLGTASESSLAGAGTVDPMFLSTAIGLSTLANIANLALHRVRISGLEGTEHELVTIREQIFAERADACFSVRSLEVQADFFTRATEAFVEFVQARVPETAHPLTILDGRLDRGSTANATAAKATACDVAQISKSLKVVNSHLRRAMVAAVQTACHSAASGEVIIQANIDELSKEIEEAEEELMEASIHLIADITGGIFSGVVIPTIAAKEELKEHIEQGEVVMDSLVGLAEMSEGKWEQPKGISTSTWRVCIGGMGILWTAATAIATSMHDSAFIEIIVQFDVLLESLYQLVTGESSDAMDVAVGILDIMTSALLLVNECVHLAHGKANPSLQYVIPTIQTLSSIVMLARTSLQLERERGQQREVIGQAQSTRSEARLLRSYGTCNALGTAWKVSGAAGALVKQSEAAGGVSLHDLDDVVLTKVYEQYVEERPALAAKVLLEALSLRTPGVTEELVGRAEALASVAPITDFAVASDRQQLEALGALGFRPISTASRRARFLICRGCGDSVITGMKVVADNEMFKELERNFSDVPGHFGDLRMPRDSTLNFVQLPKGEGFSMLAFAKVPLAAVATHALPVLFDLREDVFSIEAKNMKEGAPEIFREKATAILKRNEVEVLSWKTDHVAINDLVNAMKFGAHCDDHPSKLEFGSLDILAGRFLLASPVEQTPPLRSLVPEGLFQQGRFLTVTRGCGCRMGHLGNPYRAGGPDTLARWWMAIDEPDDENMFQTQRCRWRYDVWISEKPLIDVSTSGGDNDVDLSCTISHMSKDLLEPVGDLSHLAFTIGHDDGNRINWAWELSDWFGVGARFPGSRLLYSSQEAKLGPAGPPKTLDDDGCGSSIAFQVWRKPPARPPALERRVDEPRPTGPSVAMDFQKNVGAVLCSARCAFSDLQDVPHALGRVLGLWSRSPVPRFVPRPRGTSRSCGHVQEMLMPRGFPGDLAGLARGGLGPLASSEEVRWPLLDRVERIYGEDCDFEATLLLDPAPCGGGRVPDLRVNSSGFVEETCLPRAVGGAGVVPLHRYAVTWDLSYHDRNSLRQEEREVEDGLIRAGFNHWGEAAMVSSPKLSKDTWFWTRSLRQRIFVQRDPRVTTASGAEVCGG